MEVVPPVHPVPVAEVRSGILEGQCSFHLQATSDNSCSRSTRSSMASAMTISGFLPAGCDTIAYVPRRGNARAMRSKASS